MFFFFVSLLHSFSCIFASITVCIIYSFILFPAHQTVCFILIFHFLQSIACHIVSYFLHVTAAVLHVRVTTLLSALELVTEQHIFLTESVKREDSVFV